MPRGRLQLQPISPRQDPDVTYQADFVADGGDLFTTTAPGAGVEELLYERLRLPMPVADRLLADLRSNGRAAINGLEIGESDLAAAHMDYVRDDAA